MHLLPHLHSSVFLPFLNGKKTEKQTSISGQVFWAELKYAIQLLIATCHNHEKPLQVTK